MESPSEVLVELRRLVLLMESSDSLPAQLLSPGWGASAVEGGWGISAGLSFLC